MMLTSQDNDESGLSAMRGVVKVLSRELPPVRPPGGSHQPGDGGREGGGARRAMPRLCPDMTVAAVPFVQASALSRACPMHRYGQVRCSLDKQQRSSKGWRLVLSSSSVGTAFSLHCTRTGPHELMTGAGAGQIDRASEHAQARIRMMPLRTHCMLLFSAGIPQHAGVPGGVAGAAGAGATVTRGRSWTLSGQKRWPTPQSRQERSNPSP